MTARPGVLRVRAPRPRRRRLLILIFLLVLFLPSLITLAAEWPLFTALGYARVFGTRLVAKGVLGIGAGVFAFAFLYSNLRFAQRGVAPDQVFLRFNEGTAGLDVMGLLRRLVLP